jgi:hypothetical protein
MIFVQLTYIFSFENLTLTANKNRHYFCTFDIQNYRFLYTVIIEEHRYKNNTVPENNYLQ